MKFCHDSSMDPFPPDMCPCESVTRDKKVDPTVYN